MKTRRNFSIFVVLIMGSFLLLTVFFAGFAQAQKPIEWRIITSWSRRISLIKIYYILLWRR